MKYIKLICFLSFSLLAFTTTAQPESYTQESKVLLKELEQEIAATLLAIANNEKAKGNKINDFNCLLLLDKKDYINFGLLFELNNNKNGYDVTQVDSGSVADRLGVKVKDTILEINGSKLANFNKREVLKIFSDLTINQTLSLALNSNGKFKNLTTVLEGLHVPKINLSLGEFAENACGIEPISDIPQHF